MGLRSSVFISMILVILTRIQSFESKEISSVQTFDSVQRSSRSAKCLRGIDGSCEPIVEEPQEVAKRQSNCDPHLHLNCRLTIGRKRSLEPKPVSVSGSLNCYSPAMRTSILCKLTKLRQQISCTSEDCLESTLKRDDKKNKENDKPPCDTRSPLCYTTFPGKRLGYQETDPPIMTERRQLTDDSKGSALQDAGENQQREDCNPKRDYYCRYRIPGKRDKVIKSTTQEIIDKK